jgi:hypothetical protein
MHQKFKGVSKNKNWLNDEICQSRKQRDYYAQNTKNIETKLLLIHVKARQGYLKMPLRKTKI